MIIQSFIKSLFGVIGVICLSSPVSTIHAQDKVYSLQCIYKLDFQPDSTDKQSKKSENMLLLIDNVNSVFKSLNKNIIDSLDLIPFGTGDLNEILKLMSSKRTNFRFTITKDSSEELKYMDYIDINIYQYAEPKNKFNWTIYDDTATISGYRCQKATTKYGGRIWIAWFTNEVGLSNGPYKFGGLPGLIIQIQDSFNYYSFTLSELHNSPSILYRTKKEIQKISKDDFYSSLTYYMDNQFEMMALRGVKVTSGEASIRQRMSEQRKKNNNPIELPVTLNNK